MGGAAHTLPATPRVLFRSRGDWGRKEGVAGDALFGQRQCAPPYGTVEEWGMGSLLVKGSRSNRDTTVLMYPSFPPAL